MSTTGSLCTTATGGFVEAAVSSGFLKVGMALDVRREVLMAAAAAPTCECMSLRRKHSPEGQQRCACTLHVTAVLALRRRPCPRPYPPAHGMA